jgi:hypothetical protein
MAHAISGENEEEGKQGVSYSQLSVQESLKRHFNPLKYYTYAHAVCSYGDDVSGLSTSSLYTVDPCIVDTLGTW